MVESITVEGKGIEAKGPVSLQDMRECWSSRYLIEALTIVNNLADLAVEIGIGSWYLPISKYFGIKKFWAPHTHSPIMYI